MYGKSAGPALAGGVLVVTSSALPVSVWLAGIGIALIVTGILLVRYSRRI